MQVVLNMKTEVSGIESFGMSCLAALFQTKTSHSEFRHVLPPTCSAHPLRQSENLGLACEDCFLVVSETCPVLPCQVVRENRKLRQDISALEDDGFWKDLHDMPLPCSHAALPVSRPRVLTVELQERSCLMILSFFFFNSSDSLNFGIM